MGELDKESNTKNSKSRYKLTKTRFIKLIQALNDCVQKNQWQYITATKSILQYQSINLDFLNENVDDVTLVFNT